ncbi:MAG: M55 family metallopeptidase [Planctomycetota bacterium]|jgi:D-amino peptidase|nr:M55 family metallopeptidase [Planctomycetota bacterium]MDP6954339.1 M55 family metallopeptidase [Planctomycetota bacterium]
MKIYISADIEGIAGIAHWDEATPDKPEYGVFRERMTEHVAAACEGAIAGGATEIVVKDAHEGGRNILAERLPRCAQLIRGWSEHPLLMVQELDPSFDAVAFVGYHSMAGSGGNPLAHTLSSSTVFRMRINGQPISEFHLYAYAAGTLGVPTALVSGDRELCTEVRAISPLTRTVESMVGVGDSTIARHPDTVREEVRAGMQAALGDDLTPALIVPAGPYGLEIEFEKAAAAYRCSHYPGARLVEAHTVGIEVEDYFDVLRALTFMV